MWLPFGRLFIFVIFMLLSLQAFPRETGEKPFFALPWSVLGSVLAHRSVSALALQWGPCRGCEGEVWQV